MHPILFEIGGFPVYTYGLLLAAAYLLGLQFAVVRGRKRGLNPNQIMDLGIWIIVSALVGAKLMLVVVDFDYSGAIPRDLRSSISASEGKIVGVDGHAVAPTRRYRVSFQLDPEGADLVELRLVLTAADKQWSETCLHWFSI